MEFCWDLIKQLAQHKPDVLKMNNCTVALQTKAAWRCRCSTKTAISQKCTNDFFLHIVINFPVLMQVQGFDKVYTPVLVFFHWARMLTDLLFLLPPGMSYPVGIVPPRTKSPVPDSSSIASYVTLRKSKKPDPRTVSPSTCNFGRLWLFILTLDCSQLIWTSVCCCNSYF